MVPITSRWLASCTNNLATLKLPSGIRYGAKNTPEHTTKLTNQLLPELTAFPDFPLL